MAKKYSAVPAMNIKTDIVYKVSIETTRGTINIDLFPEFAPVTSATLQSAI